jgi:hypothetical protein
MSQITLIILERPSSLPNRLSIYPSLASAIYSSLNRRNYRCFWGEFLKSGGFGLMDGCAAESKSSFPGTGPVSSCGYF